MSLYHKASFLLSVAKLNQLPTDEGYEVAFAGRSNAGKSSALNLITQKHGLAKTSKTPGRTQLINLFTLDDSRRLVDLPGYGYAKVSRDIRERWQATLAKYLETRTCLKGLVLLMDIRHPLKELDQEMLSWAFSRGLPVHILLTKADKLSRSAGLQVLKDITVSLKKGGLEDGISAQLFSMPQKMGIQEVNLVLNRWMDIGDNCTLQSE
jgi:GTP-binding protein